MLSLSAGRIKWETNVVEWAGGDFPGMVDDSRFALPYFTVWFKRWVTIVLILFVALQLYFIFKK